MSGELSNVAGWFSLLEVSDENLPHEQDIAEAFCGIYPAPTRSEDPRLGEIIEKWDGNVEALRPGRAVIVGFPQDEGVRRNYGRGGAAKAPDEIRKYLKRLVTTHVQRKVDLAEMPPLDVGDVKVTGSLEESQAALGLVIGSILRGGAVPVVLGGGHETAYGHYLGYVNAQMPVGVINVDAHLDVRPTDNGRGHSGSPFRQMLEHPAAPLAGERYCCVGAQPFAVSAEHFRYLRKKQGRVWWMMGSFPNLSEVLKEEIKQMAEGGCRVMVSVDADAFKAADVPGVSAPNAAGFPGDAIYLPALYAGESKDVSSFELVEINPSLDIDGRSARWAATAVWHFLTGLAHRAKLDKK